MTDALFYYKTGYLHVMFEFFCLVVIRMWSIWSIWICGPSCLSPTGSPSSTGCMLCWFTLDWVVMLDTISAILRYWLCPNLFECCCCVVQTNTHHKQHISAENWMQTEKNTLYALKERKKRPLYNHKILLFSSNSIQKLNLLCHISLILSHRPAMSSGFRWMTRPCQSVTLGTSSTSRPMSSSTSSE